MKLFLFLVIISFSYAQFNVSIENLTEYKVLGENVVLKITAEKKVINNKDLKKILFFLNKEEIISNKMYYENGIFEAKDILVIEKSSKEPFGSDGFCLWFDVVPVIVVLSTGQAAERRLFTIMHELVHLGLRQSVFDGKINAIN